MAVRGLKKSRSAAWVDLRTSGKGYGICRMPIGAPATVMYAEQLIALGARKLVIIGEAGALSDTLEVNDVVVCEKALRDEGTSYHYVKPSRYAKASPAIVEWACQSLESVGIEYVKGSSWTIDAPFRETREEIKRHRAERVLVVEMEAAALFAFAQRRNVEAAAVFVVSDHVLHDKGWKPRFHKTLPRLMEVFNALKHGMKK